ncbi:alcohol dehydrogenase [Clostridium thermosuccinogenes]|uniref:Alcohol dehydrogenase n=1 Tax=Clostridium thermosuccinogenes TaxID=84032 RepID=A0A2K2FF66_9CLOT|nr:iron-containing alcohol dehydrogenase [Pseudoclostridium thermosuccinogenes]AUS98535.1 alcohol dehydrogenase [Pseudoclostridium thermosuccinogenes]PNT95979.1 alcohol dehydrogenase [Pseudoclostridium thermosuccinogenes]PNT97406.1 alcohol dehydrogenase [Pseudoclostridium thermosuccinogenes]
MNFNYYIPTRILFGPGKLEELSKENLPGKKALIVISSGKSMKENGYLDRLIKILQSKQIEYALFDKILPNPIKTHVMEGAQLARKEGCDFVIGLGGGSSIDSAKSIAVMATNPGDYWDYVSGGTGKGMPLQNPPLPIVAITTTAGTGTEADPWTVITKEDTNEKIGFGNYMTFPVLSVVDPELMLSVPEKLTAYQGFDALFHSTEGYIASIATPMSDIYALKSIELISKYLPECVKNGNNLEARTQLALANTLSGFVESISSCTSEHSLEHALSAHHPELPHGAGLIMLSEAYYTFFASKVPERFVDMAKAMGVDVDSLPEDERPFSFVKALIELQEACGVRDLKMSDYGIKKEEIPVLAENARTTMGGLFELDRYKLSLEETIEILNNAYK